MTGNRSTFEEIRTKHRLLAMARAMSRAPGYGANIEVLSIWLDVLALSASMDVLEADLRRLEELKVCTIEKVDQLMVAKLTQRGDEIANGKAWIEEIERPGPECCY